MYQYLWAYGTLRHGESNHHLLMGCSFMGMACYPGLLFSVKGHYPIFQPDQTQGGEAVIGEIYQIKPDLWSRLDELEGIEEGYYRRASFPISPAIVPGEAQLLVYVVGPLLQSFCREEYLISSGDWCQRSSFLF
ncbi:MAG: gamma-glutamylcyclotransferase family protein [Gloeobacterales cyanobacterium]